MKLSRNSNLRTLLTFAFISVGFGSAVYRYYLNPSLWQDTAALALNLLHRNYSDLTNVLDYGVVAPILFLFIEKFFASLFVDTDYGLRFFPLICFLCSIPLIYKVAMFITRESGVATASVCLFCVNTMLLSYSIEVKQYIVEVFTLLILLYFTHRLERNFNKGLILISVAGIIALYLSYTSVIVLFSLSIYLFVIHRHHPATMVKILIMAIIWFCAFGFLYLFFAYSNLENIHLRDHWDEKLGYLPFRHPELLEFSTRVLKNISTIVVKTPLHHWTWKLFSVFYISGIALLAYQRKFSALFLLLFPLLTHLVISSLELYPVAPRLMLYQAPLYIITISVVFSSLNNLLEKYFRIPVMLFFPAFLLLFFHNPFLLPEKDVGMKSNLKYIQSNIQKGDTVYIYHPAVLALKYYERMGYLDSANNIIYGSEILDHGSTVPQQLSSIDGRLWLIFSELNWSSEDEAREGRFLIDYLNTRGLILDQYETPDDRIYLFKL